MSEHTEQTQTHEIVSPKVYVAVYFALLAGLGITILVSKYNLGIFNPILVLVIAFGQASLVALYSMHLKNSSKLNKLSVGSCFFVLAILIVMVLIDCSSRAWGSW